MSTSLTPKLPHEKTLIDADFTPLLDTGVTLSSPVVTIAWYDGVADANPSAMLSGVATVGTGANANIVSQTVLGGIAGATYLLTFSITDSEEQIQDIQLALPVVAVRLG